MSAKQPGKGAVSARIVDYREFRLGVFRDGREKTVLGEGRMRRGAWGAYLSFDQLVFKESGPGEQGLGVFVRASFADEDVNRLAWFWSCGLQVRGLVRGRRADVLGLGAYQLIASSKARRAVDRELDRETGVELYYAAQLLPWLTLTPHLQVIANPGGREKVRNALVALLRFRVTL